MGPSCGQVKGDRGIGPVRSEAAMFIEVLVA
jgi:hypothetical protein